MTKVLLHIAAMLALALVSTTQAQSPKADSDAEARRFFEAGKASFDAGSFEEALSFFERAFERSHRPQLRYNIGLAADRLRQDEKALDAFYAYLADVPDAENRAEVEGRIRALEKAQADREATTPEAVAQQASADTAHDGIVAADGVEHADSGSGKPITKKWWFWTGIGAVVVTGVIIGIVAAGGGGTQADAFESRSGVAVMALTGQ